MRDDGKDMHSKKINPGDHVKRYVVELKRIERIDESLLQ
jgi:hypothetical protein